MQVSEPIKDNVLRLVNVLPKDMKLLGIDLGTKTIGLAISDPRLRVASAIMTLKRSKLKKNLPEISHIASEFNVGGIVMGLPIKLDGTLSARAQATKDWAFSLTEIFNMPIAFWDERLSTAAVERAMISADVSRKKRAQQVDAAAATYILQGALDFIQFNAANKPMKKE